MELSLKNKNVLISGGSNGIGLSIVTGFLEEGANVIVISRGISFFDEFKVLLGFNKDSLFFFSCDLIDERILESTSRIILKKFGTIDIVISNVGSGKSSSSPISEKEQWDKVWDINFSSALNLARVFTPHLTKSKGVLIFISSIAGLEAIPAPTDYSVAKSALVSFSKMLAKKLAPDVRVNVVLPGNIMTKNGTWKQKWDEDSKNVSKMINSSVPLKRFGTPEEVSNAVLFLSSNRASFITGSCLVVDGGQTATFH